jgi:hypothetical protein
MKKIIILISILLTSQSCEKELDVRTKYLNEDFLENTTLTNDYVYRVDRKLKVGENTTLVLQPGVQILNKTGNQIDPSYFIIEKGGEIISEGTPQLFLDFN